MAINPPSTAKTGIKREFFGLPLWAWGLGVVGFGVGLFIYLRQRGANTTSTDSSAAQVPAGVTSPAVYPFYMGATPGSTTSSQNFGTIVGKGFAGNVVPNTVPLYAMAGEDPSKPLDKQSVSWAPDKTVFTVTGTPQVGNWGGKAASFYPVIYQGQNYFVSQADVYPQNTSTGTGGGGYGLHSGTMPAAL